MLVWDVFSLVYILISWYIMFNRTVPQIRKTAQADDGSSVYVYAMIVIASFAAMCAVTLLIISQDDKTAGHPLFIPVTLAGMLLSWTFVHTIYSFHYAHLYYDDAEDGKAPARGLDFPGEEKPDYIDFAYFSFTIGATFQVSDVGISSRAIRRSALLHAMLSFALNTFVVALTINLIAGLAK
ncbi:MAG: DUF1345 domain-containing protein [Mucilaginibacter polytrichastri]|nr:DUF1345 domain-containing protein [Mucilaginibacter polytrichastri]